MEDNFDIRELDIIIYQLNKKFFAEITKDIDIPVTSTQLYMLYYLRTKGECMVTDIANYLGVTLGAVTSLVDRLIDHGFVERRRNKNDRRQVIIKINKGGEDFLKKIDVNRKRILIHCLDTMNQEEFEYIIKVIKNIITKLLNI